MERYSLCGNATHVRLGSWGQTPGRFACREFTGFALGMSICKGSKIGAREELDCSAFTTRTSTDPAGSGWSSMALQIPRIEEGGVSLPALCSGSCGLALGDAGSSPGRGPFSETDSTESCQQPAAAPTAR